MSPRSATFAISAVCASGAKRRAKSTIGIEKLPPLCPSCIRLMSKSVTGRISGHLRQLKRAIKGFRQTLKFCCSIPCRLIYILQRKSCYILALGFQLPVNVEQDEAPKKTLHPLRSPCSGLLPHLMRRDEQG